MKRPVMKSIWEDIAAYEADYCEIEITRVEYAKPLSDLEIYFEIIPYDKNDKRGKVTHKKLTAYGAYIFDQPPFENFIVSQALKRVFVYPEITRLDIVTTGALLRIECDSYEFEELEQL